MSDVPPDQPPPGSGWQQPGGGYQPGAGWQQQQPPQQPPQQQPPPPPPGGYQPQYGGYQQQPQGPMGPGGQTLAEWWKRLLAFLLDFLIVYVPLSIISFGLVGVSFTRDLEIDPITGEITRTGGFLTGASLLMQAISIVVPVLYFGLLNGSARGQTVGKMALRIQVRDANTGAPIGMGRGVVRALIFVVLLAACLIPGIIDGLWPLWDQRRQSIHDKGGNSVVVDAA